MQYDLSVAVIGNLDELEELRHSDRQPWDDIEGDGCPYGELPKVALTVAGSVALRDLIRMASRQAHGDPSGPSGAWVNFYRPEDEQAYTRAGETTIVPLVDDAGQVGWKLWYSDEVTMDELARSAASGALRGDPLRPYLIHRQGYGDALPGWDDYALALFVVKEIIGVVADAHGSKQAISAAGKRVIEFFRRKRGLPEIVEEKKDDWHQRMADPFLILQFVDQQPWDANVLGRLLGIPPSDAAILLEGRGFTKEPQSDLWTPPQIAQQGTSPIRSIHSLIIDMTWDLFGSTADQRRSYRNQWRITLERAIVEQQESTRRAQSSDE